MKLLIHHHSIAFENNGEIWLQSFIGAWVNELAKYFDEVGLLLHTSEQQNVIQDYSVKLTNVRLHSLGIPMKFNLSRNQLIKSVCNKISRQYDCLLIRGITPKQSLIFHSCKTKCKSYLLVGSIADSRPSLGFSFLKILNWFLYWLRIWEMRQIAKNSLLLANSKNSVEELKIYFGKKGQFVPTNTIQQSDFIPFQFRPFRKEPLLLFCGRIVREKGIEELIIAISILKEQGLNCRLQIVGKGSESYLAYLATLILTYTVEEQVEFLGFIPFGDKLLSYYRNSDFYILPSWHEGFPHSIWEAAASCTPIITTRVGGISGLVSENEVWFVPAKDPASIASGIFSLFKTPEIAKKNVASAYNLALNFTVESCGRVCANTLMKFLNFNE